MFGTQIQFSTENLNKLQKLAEEGLSKAGTALSEMTEQPINIAAPNVFLVHLNEIPEMLGGPETMVVGIYLSIAGELAGHMTLIFPTKNALNLADALLQQPPGTTVELDEMSSSALGEVGNITGSFFLNAIGDGTGLRPEPSPPAIAHDMVSAIIDVILADVGQDGDEGLVIETSFNQNGNELSGYFLVIPIKDSLHKLMDKLNS